MNAKKIEYVNLLCDSIKSTDKFSSDQDGSIFITRGDSMLFCSPAWLMTSASEDCIGENVLVYFQWEDGEDNTKYENVDFYITYDLEKDLEKYKQIVFEFEF